LRERLAAAIQPLHSFQLPVKNQMSTADPISIHLADQYDTDYFLTDCGGHHEFLRHRGRLLTDPRLGALADLISHFAPRRLLDLGCGRGELAFQAARQGVEVVAVDYSPAALELAASCFEGCPELGRRVRFVCRPVTDLHLHGTFDAVVAADLVEHLSPPEVVHLYALVARHLSPEGVFLVHTFPNRWHYDYDYPRRRRAAAAAGTVLPADPRSTYEKKMHINEQRPQVLRRSLRRHFPHLLFWFAAPEDPVGSLVHPFSRRQMAAARDLFAIAANRPLEVAAIAEVLAPTPPLPLQEAVSMVLRVPRVPATMIAGDRLRLAARIENRSCHRLVGRGVHPVLISYHWQSVADGKAEVFDGLRSSPGTIPPGASATVAMLVEAPPRPGCYRLQPRLVQEGIRWHEGPVWPTPLDLQVTVVQKVDE
jgi:2-polyprenyl-3-methyl-5-hydroxy-6-metoxy-1,4-benzoquinol methylase